jgi:hypothetical protein
MQVVSLMKSEAARKNGWKGIYRVTLAAFDSSLCVSTGARRPGNAANTRLTPNNHAFTCAGVSASKCNE